MQMRKYINNKHPNMWRLKRGKKKKKYLVGQLSGHREAYGTWEVRTAHTQITVHDVKDPV